MTGKLIVLEGGEGSGKSSVIKHLANVLEADGKNVVRSREPGGTPGGEIIRRILITSGSSFDPIANAMLFASARRDHVEKLIRPALNDGKWVIVDRYILSTLAYQGYGEGVDRDFLIRMHEETTGPLWPDLTIVLDIDPRIGLDRSKARLSGEGSNEDRFEGLDIAFHDRVRRGMLEYELSPRIMVDASAPIDHVASDVASKVNAFFAVALPS